ncbi:MAG: hypothetical protein KC438_07525, partial [Thermomicrobiales bacterium]|nr:hypothetical protein [Thermomicrobiales bacterium]
VDPAGQYAAVGSSDPRAPITLVDLDSYTTRAVEIEAGEVGLMIGSDPLTLFHRNDTLAQIEAYPFEGLLSGSTTPTGVVATGAFGHGEGILHDAGLIAAATDDGLDIVAFDGERIEYVHTLPWDTEDRSGGRAFFVRVAPDGEHVISYIANRGTEETPWGEWENDVYIANPATGQVIRTALGPGLVFRLAQADDVALFFNQHPDGDNAFVVDTNADSPTFGQVIATIPLDPLSHAVGPDESPWEGESRVVAITPDGSIGYVTAGGDSKIVVIDIASGSVSGVIETPTPLSTGGYLLALVPGQPVVDTIGR